MYQQLIDKIREIEHSLLLNSDLDDAADFWNEALAKFSAQLIAYIEADEKDEQ